MIGRKPYNGIGKLLFSDSYSELGECSLFESPAALRRVIVMLRKLRKAEGAANPVAHFHEYFTVLDEHDKFRIIHADLQSDILKAVSWRLSQAGVENSELESNLHEQLINEIAERHNQRPWKKHKYNDVGNLLFSTFFKEIGGFLFNKRDFCRAVLNEGVPSGWDRKTVFSRLPDVVYVPEKPPYRNIPRELFNLVEAALRTRLKEYPLLQKTIIDKFHRAVVRFQISQLMHKAGRERDPEKVSVRAASMEILLRAGFAPEHIAFLQTSRGEKEIRLLYGEAASGAGRRRVHGRHRVQERLSRRGFLISEMVSEQSGIKEAIRGLLSCVPA